MNQSSILEFFRNGDELALAKLQLPIMLEFLMVGHEQISALNVGLHYPQRLIIDHQPFAPVELGTEVVQDDLLVVAELLHLLPKRN
jgi:hypothetical protein